MHAGLKRAWACGPFGTYTPDGGGPAGAVTVVQVRLLDDSLVDRLRRAVRPGRSVRLGAHRYQVAAPARLIGQVTWERLRQWSGERAWQVRFVTPVCLRRGNRTSPWPAPESIARGLAERWHRLHPATAPPLPGSGTGPVWVSDVDGHSETQILTRRGGRREVVSGFTGRIRYVCDQGTDAEAADFSALIAFAAFAGAGCTPLTGSASRASNRPGSRPRSEPASREHADGSSAVGKLAGPRRRSGPGWPRPGLMCWPATGTTACSGRE